MLVDNRRGKNSAEDADTVVGKEPCPDCGSSNNLVRWADGHAHCFTPDCGRHEASKDGTSFSTEKIVPASNTSLLKCRFDRLGKRRIDEKICKMFSYGLGDFTPKGKAKSTGVQVANFFDKNGQVVAQKLRLPGKDFVWLGNRKNIEVPLFGAHLWSKGRKLVVTEGEIDALSVAQAEGGAWPVVSVIDGAQSAKKCIQKSLEYLENFDEVIFMFDSDEHGIKAAEECALLLPAGKARVARLQEKDASDMLTTGRVKELLRWKWEAPVYRPDCILAGSEMWDTVKEPYTFDGVEYPWQGLTDITYGIRKAELTTLTAGSGIGKSSICRELAFHLISEGYKVGYIALEEVPKKSARGIMGVAVNLPLHMNHVQPDDEVMRQAFDLTLGTGNIFMYNHFGSIYDLPRFISQVRYMVEGLECDFIILDHLSMMVSGHGGSDERVVIDKIMTDLRTLVQKTECGMILVSHLKKLSGGLSHETGAATQASDLRGSAAIQHLSDIIIGAERNLQSEALKNITCLRVLKNRYSGDTGVACFLEYDKETGRLHEVSKAHVNELIAEADKEDATSAFSSNSGEDY